MALFLYWLQRYLAHSSPTLLQAEEPSRNPILDTTDVLEEECFPYYRNFYPVKIGETLGSRYQVISKLGYGSASTVWMCRDLLALEYAVVKVYLQEGDFQTNNEIEIYKRLASIESDHPGRRVLRTIHNHFTLAGPLGPHQCLVHEPLGESLDWLKQRLQGSIQDDLLRYMAFKILQALDFLHSEANVIHTDLKAENFLSTIIDEEILPTFDVEEQTTPTPCKIVDDKFIYVSRTFPQSRDWGSLRLIDFGEARVGPQQYKHILQPVQYRAPEVLLQLDWDYKVDIWNFGVMIWHLRQGAFLFDPEDSKGNHSIGSHFAQITAFLGKPPVALLQKSPVASEFFNEHGTCKCDDETSWIAPQTEDVADPDRDQFLSFIRATLEWDPSLRSSAKELLKLPWITEGKFKTT